VVSNRTLAMTDVTTKLMFAMTDVTTKLMFAMTDVTTEMMSATIVEGGGWGRS
jgi:hypothetical protein